MKWLIGFFFVSMAIASTQSPTIDISDPVMGVLQCTTKITYRHWVYGLRCPYSSNEVLLGIVRTNPYYVECGKIETFCLLGRESS